MRGSRVSTLSRGRNGGNRAAAPGTHLATGASLQRQRRWRRRTVRGGRGSGRSEMEMENGLVFGWDGGGKVEEMDKKWDECVKVGILDSRMIWNAIFSECVFFFLVGFSNVIGPAFLFEQDFFSKNAISFTTFTHLGGGNSNIFVFLPRSLGEIIQFVLGIFFIHGLVQPPTSHSFLFFWTGCFSLLTFSWVGSLISMGYQREKQRLQGGVWFPSGNASSISHLKKSSESHLTVPKKGKFHQILLALLLGKSWKNSSHFNANGIEKFHPDLDFRFGILALNKEQWKWRAGTWTMTPDVSFLRRWNVVKSGRIYQKQRLAVVSPEFNHLLISLHIVAIWVFPKIGVGPPNYQFS